MVDRPELKFPAYKPRVHPPVASEDLFEHIRREDVLLHHPFDSFNVIIDLVKEASVDPNVLAIKQTLYRTGHQSPLVNALIEAARNGKDVTVVIELRARLTRKRTCVWRIDCRRPVCKWCMAWSVTRRTPRCC
jgi:polyphosphate kinase